MNNCPLCGQTTMPAYYSEAIKDEKRKDITGGSYWYKPVEENEHYCYYHKKVMAGEFFPTVIDAYSPENQIRIRKAHEAFQEQLYLNKRRRGR